MKKKPNRFYQALSTSLEIGLLLEDSGLNIEETLGLSERPARIARIVRQLILSELVRGGMTVKQVHQMVDDSIPEALKAQSIGSVTPRNGSIPSGKRKSSAHSSRG